VRVDVPEWLFFSAPDDAAIATRQCQYISVIARVEA
jgi:hypothetical protein